MAEKVDLRKIKDQAARAIKRGNWEKAYEKYQILVKNQPKDLRLKMKLGDILVKLSEYATNTTHDTESKGGILYQANNSLYSFFLHFIDKELFTRKTVLKIFKDFKEFIHILYVEFDTVDIGLMKDLS